MLCPNLCFFSVRAFALSLTAVDWQLRSPVPGAKSAHLIKTNDQRAKSTLPDCQVGRG